MESLKEKIQKEIMQIIYKNEIKKGEIIPSENALSLKFSCSRNTVRSAITPLVYLGILEAKQGLGYVVSKNLGQNVIHSFRYFQKITRTEINKIKHISPELRKHFNLQNNENVVFLNKKYFKESKLMASQIVVLNKNLIFKIDYSEMEKSIVEALKKQGLPISHSTNNIIFSNFRDLSNASKKLGWNEKEFIIESIVDFWNNKWIAKTIRIVKKENFRIYYSKFNINLNNN